MSELVHIGFVTNLPDTKIEILGVVGEGSYVLRRWSWYPTTSKCEVNDIPLCLEEFANLGNIILSILKSETE